MAIKITKEFEGILYAPSKYQIGNPTGCMYPRVIELRHSGKKNVLLATFENYSKKEPPFAPIYRSLDGGISWTLISKIKDVKNNFGMRFQPVLYELECDVADLKKGTIIYAGNSIPKDMSSTELLLFISRDCGKTWEYRSSIALGGAPIEQNFSFLGPVWEPFIYLDKFNDLVVIFSDERLHTKDKYNQVIGLMKSVDGGKTWQKEKLIVALNNSLRPGMPIVAKMKDKYFLCYEIVGTECNGIYYKLSNDGLDFGNPNEMGIKATTKEGYFLGSMPYCIYTPKGNEDGTILLNAKRDNGEIGLNLGSFLFSGDCKTWNKIPSLIEYDNRILQTGWSKGMTFFDNYNKFIILSPVQSNSKNMHIKYAIGNVIYE